MLDTYDNDESGDDDIVENVSSSNLSSSNSSSSLSGETRTDADYVHASDSSCASKNEIKNAILSLDIGTTNLKCSIYDTNLKIIYSNSSKVKILI